MLPEGRCEPPEISFTGEQEPASPGSPRRAQSRPFVILLNWGPLNEGSGLKVLPDLEEMDLAEGKHLIFFSDFSEKLHDA